MHRCRLTLLAAVVALLASAAVATGPDPARAAAPATFELYGAGLASPIQVGATSAGRPEPVRFYVAASEEVEDVTLTAGGEGLTVQDPTSALGPAGPGQAARATVLVSADTPGLHTLTLTASAPGATPVTREVTGVWRAGGALLPGAGSLAGRAYAAQGFSDPDGNGDLHRYSTVITFVDATRATYGLPGHLATACDGEGAKRCVRYAWDRSSRLVQVGDGIIGRVPLSAPAAFDGAVPASPLATGESYEKDDFVRLRFPEAGHRYAGSWDYRAPYEQGVYAQQLTLRKDGTYALSVRAGTPGFSGPEQTLRRDWAGRYQLGSGGRLVLRDARGRRTLTVARLALGSDPSGPARPTRIGVQLEVSLEVDQGAAAGTTLVDGNLLAPRS